MPTCQAFRIQMAGGHGRGAAQRDSYWTLGFDSHVHTCLYVGLRCGSSTYIYIYIYIYLHTPRQGRTSMHREDPPESSREQRGSAVLYVCLASGYVRHVGMSFGRVCFRCAGRQQRTGGLAAMAARRERLSVACLQPPNLATGLPLHAVRILVRRRPRARTAARKP